MMGGESINGSFIYLFIYTFLLGVGPNPEGLPKSGLSMLVLEGSPWSQQIMLPGGREEGELWLACLYQLVCRAKLCSESKQ